MKIEMKLDTIESKALAEWLENNRENSLDDLARRHSLDLQRCKEMISEIYTRCVNAAIAYHADKSGEMSHGYAAEEAGVDLWIYIYFKMKYRIHHDASREGLEHAKHLKNNDLYKPGLL